MPSLQAPAGQRYLADLSPADGKFDSKKAFAQKVSRLFNLPDDFVGFLCGEQLVNFGDYAIRIDRCGSWLLFAKVNGKLKLRDANFCKSPACPMCQWRRASKWRAKLLSLLEPIQQEYPTHRWLFLTLTIRNCDINDLRATLKHLREAYNRLSARSEYPFDGAIKSVEVTRAWDCYHMGTYLGRHGTKWINNWEYQNKCKLTLEPTDEVHPHIHVMGLVPASYFTGRAYVKQERWVELWKEALKVDYKPMVHIKAVKPKKNTPLVPSPEEFSTNPDTDITGMVRAVCETLKYTVKEQDLVGTYCTDEAVNARWLKTMIQQLYKMRRVEYRGVLKEMGKQLQEAYDDDNLIHNDIEESKGEPEETVEARWIRAIEQFVIIEKVPDSDEDVEKETEPIICT